MKIAKKDDGENKFLIEFDEKKNKQDKKALENEIDLLVDLLKQTKLSNYEAQFYLKRVSEILESKTNSAVPPTPNRYFYELGSIKFNHIISFFRNYIRKLVKLGIGALLITLGVSMIVIPAPFPAFEIATIYYFNPQDGITIMDLISLLIIFTGVSIIIETFLKKTVK